MLWVACSECKRGGNGEQSCSSGWRKKRGGKNGCFLGQLLPKFDAQFEKTTQQKVNQQTSKKSYKILSYQKKNNDYIHKM
jgi:hypothetical protein